MQPTFVVLDGRLFLRRVKKVEGEGYRLRTIRVDGFDSDRGQDTFGSIFVAAGLEDLGSVGELNNNTMLELFGGRVRLETTRVVKESAGESCWATGDAVVRGVISFDSAVTLGA